MRTTRGRKMVAHKNLQARHLSFSNKDPEKENRHPSYQGMELKRNFLEDYVA